MALLNFESVVGATTYMINSKMEGSEHTFKVPIKAIDVEHNKQIQRIIHHNLLPIHEVYLEGNDEASVNYWKPEFELESGNLFSPLEDCHTSFFFSTKFQSQSSNQHFKYFLKSMVDGLVELHKNGLWHGSLNAKTTYFHWQTDWTLPVFRLTGFRHGSGKKMEMMIRDWHALGCILEDFMSITKPRWTNNVDDPNFVELKDLCSSMKLNKMGLETLENRYKEVEKACFVCKEYILTHPAVFDPPSRPTYILLAYAFLDQNNLLYTITDEDVQFANYALDVSSTLVPDLKACCAIFDEFEDIEVGRKGLQVVKLERNLLSHVPKPNTLLGTEIGSTSIAVDEYFRVRQPRVVLALHQAVRYTEFKFEEPFLLVDI